MRILKLRVISKEKSNSTALLHLSTRCATKPLASNLIVMAATHRFQRNY